MFPELVHGQPGSSLPAKRTKRRIVEERGWEGRVEDGGFEGGGGWNVKGRWWMLEGEGSRV